MNRRGGIRLWCILCWAVSAAVACGLASSLLSTGEARADEPAKAAEAKAKDAAKADAGKSDAGKSDAGKSDAGKSDAGKSDAGKSDAGKSDAGKESATKEKDAKKPDAKPTVTTSGERKDVGEGEQLSFKQQKVASEMTELEERMYRLSEAIKALEPENSSRLMIGLKYAREELILQDMKKIQEELEKLALNDAVTGQKQLMTKLQRLQDLLLSTDLDFQMQLERLRMMREALRKLDGAIKEEDREQKLSKDAASAEQKRDGLKKRQATLDELIKQQTEHVDKGGELSKVEPATDEQQTAAGELGKRQDGTRKATETLAGDAAQPGDPKPLKDAAGKMTAATKNLGDKKPKDALPEMQQALDLLKKEREKTAEDLKKAEEKLAAERFASMKKDQEGNRQLTDSISELTRQLGESGQGATSELQRASGSMSKAEGELASIKPTPASQQQDDALKSLKYAREQLMEEEQKLLERLRAEVKKRVIETLTLMLEKQVAIRHSTEALGPRVKTGSRQALALTVALSKQEQILVDMSNEIITLVEETEFGIALPAALGVVRDQMDAVRSSLAKGDASELVVAAEKQIEEDLKSLMDAMKQLPSKRPPNNRSRSNNLDEQERELNRLVAELKMIRLLQLRLNGDTVSADKKREVDATAAALSAELKQRIEDLQGRQEDIRDVTERLAAQRGDEAQ